MLDSKKRAYLIEHSESLNDHPQPEFVTAELVYQVSQGIEDRYNSSEVQTIKCFLGEVVGSAWGKYEDLLQEYVDDLYQEEEYNRLYQQLGIEKYWQEHYQQLADKFAASADDIRKDLKQR